MAQNEDDVSAVSRRDFFKTVGVSSLATGVLAAAESDTVQAAPGTLGPGPVPVRLTINGRPYNLHIEPRVTLLDAVRDHAMLTGNKRVCDRGTCGVEPGVEGLRVRSGPRRGQREDARIAL